MDSSLKISLILSLCVHIYLLFFISEIKVKKIINITFPIEIIPYTIIEEKEKLPQDKETIAVKKVVPKKEKEKEVKKIEKPIEPPKTLPSAGFTSGLSLETAKFPYTYYLRQIRDKVSSNWFWGSQGGTLRAVAYFRIKRSGEVTNLKIKESSGDKVFDQISIRAINLSVPFPPLPESFPEEELGIYFEFTFRE